MMSLPGHIEALETKHAELEKRLDEELQRPLPDGPAVSALKKEKLKIKDEIARLRHA